MSYERVHLQGQTVAGFSARTSNHDPKMGEIIGGLWRRLFETPPFSESAGGKTYGVYSDYENGVKGLYTVTAAVPVFESCVLPPEAVTLRLPAGPYAVFTARGGPEAAAPLWEEIWATPLDRAFTYDLEEYTTGRDGPVLRVCIALRE